MEEIFKDIPNYEGEYQVSNLGRVKSLPRKIYNSKGIYTIKEKILKAGIGKGYLKVSISKNTKRNTYCVHQLVAITFLNHKLCGHKLVVNHKDFNKLNNHVDNLEVVTQRENANQKHIKSISKYTGVSFRSDRNKWRAYISINGKTKHLGMFNTEFQASKAYKKALKDLKL